MKKERKDKNFIKKAFFKGGSNAMRDFILAHLVYPPQALENRIEGSVHARYDIDHHGNVTAIKLYNSVGYGCDEEAIRLIRLLKFEVPKTRGLKLTFHKEIHIHFRLPNPSPPAPIIETPPVIEYQVTPPTSTTTSYQYTVTITPTPPKSEG